MASRFIGKTLLSNLHPLRLNHRPVQDQFATFRDLLARKAGQQAASAFAEPIATWRDDGGGSGDGFGSISWYTDLPGELEPIAALSIERRLAIEQRLRELVATLQPWTADARLGPWLRRALVLASPDGVVAAGNAVVLTQWGLAEQQPTDDAGLAALMAAGLGRDLSAPAPRPAAVVPPVPAHRPPIREPSPCASRPSVRGWWMLPAAAAVAAGFLALGWWQGSRLVAARFAERSSTVSILDEAATRAAIKRQQEQNAVLEREIESRRHVLAGDVCQLDPTRVPRIGPDRAAALAPAVVPPPLGGSPFRGTLAELLQQAVVLVVAPSQRGVEAGSGFFVAPDLIVTNRHVVEDGDPARLMVTSERLGHLTLAELVATTPDSQIGSPDIALLRVRGQVAVQPLALTTTIAPLDQVIAAGYPGLLMRADVGFDRLLQGDATAIPQVILSDGRINAIQPAASGMKIMPHSAAVSGGNSGGPLVDACGRVVGVNTFITADREQVAHANYAQKADTVIAFLRQHGAAVTEVSGPCIPGAPTQPASAGSPPAAGGQ